MMGQAPKTESLCCYFRLEDHIPESFWLDCWNAASSLTFQPSTVVTTPAGISRESSFATCPKRTRITVPHGEPLRYGGLSRETQSYAYCGAAGHCRDCPPKERCTPGATRKPSVRWREAAREAVRTLASIPAYERFRRARYRIEALFAELNQRGRLDRVRLRRLWTVAKQLLLAATAQNPKRLMKSLVHEHAVVALSTA